MLARRGMYVPREAAVLRTCYCLALATSVIVNVCMFAILRHDHHSLACEAASSRRLSSLAESLGGGVAQDEVDRVCQEFLADYPDDPRIVAVCRTLQQTSGKRTQRR